MESIYMSALKFNIEISDYLGLNSYTNLQLFQLLFSLFPIQKR